MKHYGDITQINGYEVPMVDIITGGSPCQDLSVAGQRAGLAGERSGLFMEQIRVIKEMRDECVRQLSMRGADEPIRPRFMVWENVSGAFSSPGTRNGENHKGEDFQAVLTEIVRIVKPDAPDIPLPKDRKWTKSGCLMGIGENGQPFSVAWRLHDAQFWGVPQRRKRIALVADFGGTSAPEVLFERDCLPRHFEQSGEKREATARTTQESTDTASYTLKIRGGREIDSLGNKAGKGALVQKELSATLGISQDQTLFANCLNSWDVQSKHIQPENGVAEALYSGERRYGGGESYVLQENVLPFDTTQITSDKNWSSPKNGDPCHPLAATAHPPTVSIKQEPLLLESNQNHATVQTDGISTTLPASMGMGGGYVPMVVQDKQTYQKTTGALMASGYQKLGTQEAMICA